MLPDIVTHDWVVAIHQRAILISRRNDLELATLIKDEPRPAGAETLRASIVERCLESVEGAEGGIDRACQIASRCAARVGSHNLPEHAVVGMTTAIVAHSRADTLRHIIDMAHQLINIHRGKLRLVFECSVQVVDIRSMMLVVMQLHRLGVDVGLERVVAIREGRNFESHEHFSLKLKYAIVARSIPFCCRASLCMN